MFLASVFGHEQRKLILERFRSQIWNPEADPVARGWNEKAVRKECLSKIRSARLFLCILDDNPGCSVAFPGTREDIKLLEIEIFQALIHEVPLRIFTLPGFERNRRLANLVHLIAELGLGTAVECQPGNDLIEKIRLLLHPFELLVGNWRDLRRRKSYRRHNPNLNVRFLHETFSSFATEVDGEVIEQNLDQVRMLAGSDHATRLALLWANVRRLCAVPYTDPRFREFVPLWDRTLSEWARSAAWYGLHGDTPVGRLAAVNSLIEVRGPNVWVYSGASRIGAIHGSRGGRASELYSMAKRAPRRQRRILLREALSDIEAELTAGAIDKPNLLAIRGSIFLQLWRINQAVSDYETVLTLREELHRPSPTIGEAKSELGWGYAWKLRLRKAAENLESGVALLREGTDLGFTIRALRKLAVVYAVSFCFPSSIRTVEEACGLSLSSSAYGQLNAFWRALYRALRFMRGLRASGTSKANGV